MADLVAEHVMQVGLLHDLTAPVPLQQCVLDDDGDGPQDEGQEEVGVDVVPGAVQLPVDTEHQTVYTGGGGAASG